MDKDPIGTYAATMRTIDLTDDAYRAIGDSVHRAARRRAQAPTSRTHVFTRRAALGGCAAAAALALTYAGMRAISLEEAVLSEGFALAAYADGSGEGDRVGISIDNEFLQGGFWGFADDGPFTDDGTGMYDTGIDEGFAVSLLFDLDVRGVSMRSISYELDGDAYFRYDPHADPATKPEAFDAHAFTIAPGELDLPYPPFRKGRVYLMANIPADTPGMEHPQEIEALVAAYTAAARVIAQSTITLRVTFEDESVETHKYRIEPTDALPEAIEALTDGETFADPAFTIEQLY